MHFQKIKIKNKPLVIAGQLMCCAAWVPDLKQLYVPVLVSQPIDFNRLGRISYNKSFLVHIEKKIYECVRHSPGEYAAQKEKMKTAHKSCAPQQFRSIILFRPNSGRKKFLIDRSTKILYSSVCFDLYIGTLFCK